MTDLLAILHVLGDIYGGVFCPAGNDNMVNCPVGSYCPTPEHKFLCPAGKFCPYKSTKPETICGNCEEGSTQVVRDTYGWVVIGLLIAAAFLFAVYVLMKKFRKDVVDRVFDLQRRKVDSLRRTYVSRKKRQDQLERIRPKLDLISRRLAALEKKLGNSPTIARKATFVTEKEVIFDARKLFDAIDMDSNGEASFSELNAILELNPFELSEFVRRMNALEGVSDEKNFVTRPTFVRHFLQVLEETSYFSVTPEEAGQLFDEIAELGRTKNAEVLLNQFYSSSMSIYLTDNQIYDLIKVRRMVIPLNIMVNSFCISWAVAYRNSDQWKFQRILPADPPACSSIKSRSLDFQSTLGMQLAGRILLRTTPSFCGLLPKDLQNRWPRQLSVSVIGRNPLVWTYSLRTCL